MGVKPEGLLHIQGHSISSQGTLKKLERVCGPLKDNGTSLGSRSIWGSGR
jgi:hypothetical protein